MPSPLLMNQRPADGAGALSPLAEADFSAIAGSMPIQAREDAGKGHLIIRGSASDQALVQQISALGLTLPVEPLTSSEAGQRVIRWLSPDEWLLTLPAEQTTATEAHLATSLGDQCAVVDVSGGQTLVMLNGSKAEELLRKSSSYDFHPSHFPPGKVVTTTFAQTQATIRRTGTEQFELVLRRSFADYLWRWIRDAAAEYGLDPSR